MIEWCDSNKDIVERGRHRADPIRNRERTSMENSAKKVTGGASSPLKQGLRAKDLIALGVFD